MKLSNPYLLESIKDAGRRLSRREIDAREARNESWMQELLYCRPELLPIDGFGSFSGPLIPLGREIPTGRGPIDLLYVGPDGQYLEQLEASPTAVNAAREGRMWVRFHELKPTDVQVIFQAARSLVERLRAEVG